MTAEQSAVILSEWEALGPDSEPKLKGRFLDDPALRDLARRLSESGRIEITELRQGLLLHATSFVGNLRLCDLDITIQPKIRGLPLLHLLRYALGLRNLDLFSRTNQSADSSMFQDLLIHQLASEAQELISRGLRRKYVRVAEDLRSPRGRIDIELLARRLGAHAATLPCIHHPRLEDSPLNRVLLQGLLLGSYLATDDLLRARLRRLARLLEDTVSPIRLDSHTLALLNRELDRLAAAYRPAILLISLLMDSIGVILEDGAQPVQIPGLLFDMNRLFQALISRFLAENLLGYVVRDEHRLRGMMSYDSEHNPRGRRAPQPRPDFVVFDGSRCVAILDTKYRDLWERELPRDMLYQLAIYALSGISGGESTILYPSLHQEARVAVIEIRDPVQGDRRARVILRPVDMKMLARLVAPDADRVLECERVAFARYLAFGETASPDVPSIPRAATHPLRARD